MLGVFEEDERYGGYHVWSFVDRRDKRERKKEVWRLEPEGEAEEPEATGLGSEVKGFSVNPEGESRHRHVRAKKSKEGKRESNKNGKEGKWEGTLGRGCGGSESEKESDSGGI